MQWMADLEKDPKSRNSYKLWEREKGLDRKIIGFGYGARKLFRAIANQLSSFHFSEYFYGDLWNRIKIFISRGRNVTVRFTHHPIKDNKRFSEGVHHDMVHFRFMVASLIKATKIKLADLPEEFCFFFARYFTVVMEDKRIACFYQAYHPIFFNGQDKIQFIQALVDFRE